MSTTLCSGMTVPTALIAAPTRERAEESQGSFSSISLRKLFGYHEKPAACGARKAVRGAWNSGASARMPRELSPRPWIRTTALSAASSVGPNQTSSLPRWGSSVMNVGRL